MSPSTDPLGTFSPATSQWFRTAFHRPTEAQEQAWAAITAGANSLVVAPTGSGKTLAAFLWALDRLAGAAPAGDARHRCRVLYISPLKALAMDVERNLRAPLAGIRQAAARLGTDIPPITVGMRTGDTPEQERRSFARTPPDILVTTPESLFLLLTSAARDSLRGIDTVIVDEVHALAGGKRGAHLALSLQRLDALLTGGPAQRIGLSATVRPIDEVATFLGGVHPVSIVAPESNKQLDIRVEVPVPDMTELGTPAPSAELTGSVTAAPPVNSIWPSVEQRIFELIGTHSSTIAFTNSRRLAERLTAKLNELANPVTDPEHVPAHPFPAQAVGQSGTALGVPADGDRVVARAHHGSMSREQRTLVEEELKSGRLSCVVATSSLELGIDMGA
ncbi:MAG: DEAD/DEAH box helicase, partial [Sciscionella sp.]